MWCLQMNKLMFFFLVLEWLGWDVLYTEPLTGCCSWFLQLSHHDWVLRPTVHKIGHFRDAIPSQYHGKYWKTKIKTRKNDHQLNVTTYTAKINKRIWSALVSEAHSGLNYDAASSVTSIPEGPCTQHDHIFLPVERDPSRSSPWVFRSFCPSPCTVIQQTVMTTAVLIFCFQMSGGLTKWKKNFAGPSINFRHHQVNFLCCLQ